MGQKEIITNNDKAILRAICRHYGITRFCYLYKILKSHPDFPSFLSLQYMLSKMKKESFALKTNYIDLINYIPKPFVAQIKTNVDLFLFVNDINEKNVYVKGNRKNIEIIPRKSFEKIWTGNILVIDEKQPDLKIPIAQKIQLLLSKIQWKYCIFSCFLFVLFFFTMQIRDLTNIFLFFIISTGLCFSILEL